MPKELLVGAVDKLAVAERLRLAHRLQGTVSDFTTDEAQCLVV